MFLSTSPECFFMQSALAQSGLPVTTPITDLKTVEVKAIAAEKSAEFVAGKIIIGRKNIEQSGANNVQEVLKKHPAVTVSGQGKVGLMGLPGYTQILIDGAPSPSAKNVLELDTVHIEKIEIVRSAVAEFGPYGIAGTINIVTRKISSKSTMQTNAGAAYSDLNKSANVAISRNVTDDRSALDYGVQFSGSKSHRVALSHAETITSSRLSGLIEFDQSQKQSDIDTDQISLSGTLLFKINDQHKLEGDPSILMLNTDTKEDEKNQWQLSQNRPIALSRRQEVPFTTMALPVKWTFRINDAQQLMVRYSPTALRYTSKSDSEDLSAKSVVNRRSMRKDVEQQIDFLKIDFLQRIENGHELKWGANVGRNRNRSDFSYFLNGYRDASLDLFGASSEIDDSKKTFYLQDEWRVNSKFAVNLGITTERRDTDIRDGLFHSQTNYQVVAPSLHFAWKINGSNQRQLRLSLARTFNAPYLDQLSLRPSINPIAPCDQQKHCIPNSIYFPDKAGNPSLQPERANGINLTYDYYVSDEGLLSLNAFSRLISDTFGNQVQLENVLWSNQPRYVARPINHSSASTMGVGIEAQLPVRDLVKSAPDISINAAINFAHSQVKALPGPYNRLADQAPWSFKLGASYTMQNVPVKLGFELNTTQDSWTQATQDTRVFLKNHPELNVNGTWTIHSKLRLRFNLYDVINKDVMQIDEYRTNEYQAVRKSQRKSNLRIGLRLELSS